MPRLFKPDRPYPLPANPEIGQKDGKPHVRVQERGRGVWYPLTERGTHYLKPAAKWAADVRFADGRRKRARFSPNRAAAELRLAELIKRIENEKAGVIDRFAGQRMRPLADHLADWLASLRANGRGAEYVALKASRLRAVIDGCGWAFPGDLSADRLETFLADLRSRRPDLPPIPEGADWFTVREVGQLLGGVSRQPVAALVRRHRLGGTGRGKTRRFPLATVIGLRDVKDHGRSSQTSNHYLQTVRQFVRWLVDNGRLDRSPFARLRPMNARLDQRRRRGELDPGELAAVFAAARGGTVFCGLSGPHRVMLYRVAVETGFRAGELGALVPDHFDLDATPPAVILPPELTKNRKGAVQPIAVDLAADLRTYLTGRRVGYPSGRGAGPARPRTCSGWTSMPPGYPSLWTAQRGWRRGTSTPSGRCTSLT